jgi:hypothetical protein
MTEQELQRIISDEIRRLSHGLFALGVRYARVGQDFRAHLPRVTIPQTDAAGLFDVQLIMLRGDLSPEQKLASFYHEIGHLHYSWSRLQRDSSSIKDDELFAYRYMMERLVVEQRWTIAAEQLQRLEERRRGVIPIHYREALDELVNGPDWQAWTTLVAENNVG